MTDDRMALIELLRKTADGDFLKAVAELTLQRLMEVEGHDGFPLTTKAPYKALSQVLCR